MRYNNYEFAEVPIPSGSTASRFYFPDLPQLREVALINIETFYAADLSTTPTGATPIAEADLIKSYLVLFANERESIFRIPLITLRRIQIQGGVANGMISMLPNFNGQKVVWAKSYIQMAASPTTTNRNFCFGIYYEK